MHHPGLEGTWLPVKAELSGEHAPEMALEKMSLLLHEGLYEVSFGGEVSDRGTYELEPGAPYPVLKITGEEGPNLGQTLPGIFQLQGDRLRVCYGLDKTLPEEFKAPAGSRHYLVTYRRRAP